MSTKSETSLSPPSVPIQRQPMRVAPCLMWAELSLREAKEMASEAMRIVAETKDVCRRSKR